MSGELNLSTVTQAQSNKEATINDINGQVEAAVTGQLARDFSTGDKTLTLAQLQRCKAIIANGMTSARSLNLVAAVRDIIVRNTGSAILSLKLGSVTIALAAGACGLYLMDGTANGLYAVASGGTGGGGGGPTNPNDYGGLGAHKGWRVNVLSTIGSVGQVAMGTMELHQQQGSLDLIAGNGYTTFATGGTFGAHEAAKLFDGDDTTYYISTQTTNTAQFGVIFPSAKTVSELRLYFHNEGQTWNGPPASYKVQYSDDTTTGTDGTWTDAWGESSITSWANNTAHVTSPPMA